MRVEVRQRHIDQALALRAARGGGINSYTCPIALAMKEQAKIPLVASATVTPTLAVLFMSGYPVGEYRPSLAAQRFIDAFDRERLVRPRTFMLTEIK